MACLRVRADSIEQALEVCSTREFRTPSLGGAGDRLEFLRSL
jgi:hypothetical protein